MSEPDLLSICAIAFVGVMLLLGLEALVIRLLMTVFPERRSGAELVATAIQQAVHEHLPGARVVAVEELTAGQEGSRAEH